MTAVAGVGVLSLARNRSSRHMSKKSELEPSKGHVEEGGMKIGAGAHRLAANLMLHYQTLLHGFLVGVRHKPEASRGAIRLPQDLQEHSTAQQVSLHATQRCIHTTMD